MSFQNLLDLPGITGPVYQQDPLTGDVLLNELGQPEPYYVNRRDIDDGFYFVEYSINRILKHVKIVLTVFKNKRTFIRSKGKDRLKDLSSLIFFVKDMPAEIQEDGTQTEPAVTIFDSYFSLNKIREEGNSELDQVIKFILTEFSNSTRINGSHRLQSFHINFTTMQLDKISQANINNALA